MAYCSKCGTQLSDGNKFCQNCGAPTEAHQTNNSYNTNYNTYVRKTPTQVLAEREKLSAAVWTVIAVIQGITGLSVTGGLMWIGEIIGLDLGWSSLFTLGLAAYNGYGAYCSFQKAKRVLMRCPGIVEEYDETLTPCIIAIVVNILFGSVIGIAGAVFELFNRHYALSNAEFLENLKEDF